MKEYKVLTAKTPEEAESVMNQIARQGWIVKAMISWQTLMGPRMVITFEKDA